MRGNRVGACLLAISLVTAAGAQTGQVQSGAKQSEQDVRVSPFHPIPTGKAPGMKVQLLNSSGGQKTYAVIFSKGDEAFSGITDFARQYNITAAHFTAIGALRSAKLAWFSPALKMYKQFSVNTQVEVISMIGDIALYKGKPSVHTHAVVGFSDGSTRGGQVPNAGSDVNG